jgi:hypothetical protein
MVALLPLPQRGNDSLMLGVELRVVLLELSVSEA